MDATYPSGLKQAGMKSVLYALGNYNFSPEDVMVGVVGCRKPSVYGQVITQKIVASLVDMGCVVVSGFMYGIDMAAHNAVLEKGGKTLAVLGYGFSHLHKSTPPYLIEQVSSTGAFLTEYEQHISPKKWTFAKRNKVIAGLCSLLIVIEAEQKSGSFITCHWAVKFKRSVYAVPGSILSEKSTGTNRLISTKQAKMLQSVSELSSILGKQMGERAGYVKNEDKLHDTLQQLLNASPLSFDQLLGGIRNYVLIDPATLTESLMRMELNKEITKIGNLYYGR
jgi:DNA processing protein